MKPIDNVNLPYRDLQETLIFIFKNCECSSVVCLPTDEHDEIKINFLTSKICDIHCISQFCNNSINLRFSMSGRHSYNIAVFWSENLPF